MLLEACENHIPFRLLKVINPVNWTIQSEDSYQFIRDGLAKMLY